MDKYKFLKSINDSKTHHVKDPHLDNPFNQFLLELDKQRLIKVTLVYLSSGRPGIVAYWTTAKDIDCIDIHRQNKKDVIIRSIIPIFTLLLGLLSHYIFTLF